MSTRILVATQGNETSDAALRVAEEIAHRQHAHVHVLAVLEPMPILDAGFAPALIPYETVEQDRMTTLLDRVRLQVREVGRGAADWTVDVRTGSPAHVIADAADASDVALAVMGIGHHSPADRLFGHETALKVSRLAPVPVLAIAPGRDRPPTRIIVGTDFSPSSLQAARTALAVLVPPATITLAHVTPDVDFPGSGYDEWRALYDESVQSAFARTIDVLGAPADVTVETVALRGDPARELLALADRTRAELVAVGSHGHGVIERLLIGSVATKVLRHARCSVLLAPVDTVASAHAVLASITTAQPQPA